MRAGAVAIALTLTTACAPPASPDVTAARAVSEHPVFYGETSPTLYTGLTTAQMNAVVAVCYSYYGQCHCSGSLISPRVVLTAAHCIDTPEGSLGANDIAIHIGPNSDSPSDIVGAYLVDYKNYNLDPGDDLGIIILNRAPNNTTPYTFKQGGITGLAGNYAQVVGYGTTHSTQYNTIRYWTSMYVEGVSGWDIYVNGYGSTGVAPGDSGSPLLYDFGSGPQVVGNASTSEQGWVNGANYVSVASHENWIQGFIDSYDNPACISSCSGIECGTVGSCVCGACDRGYECVSNSCQAMVPGTGGVCLTMQSQTNQCNNSTDCGGDICVPYGDGSSECGEACGPEPCAPGDNSSYCMPFDTGGGGYLALCIESTPEGCSTDGTPCSTTDGRSGYCLQLFQGEPIGCYTQCSPVETCPVGTGCLYAGSGPSCASVCANAECGTISGCTCGSCNPNQTCSGNQCVSSCVPDCNGKQCGPDGCGGTCGACDQFVLCQGNGACAGCLCDADVTCDLSCPCDVDCPCYCDATFSCDDGCPCDPDCFDGSGCSCSNATPGIGLALVGLVAVVRRRRRR